ncbi:hypothetical protein GW943_03330 [Candidatus Parcubacteria bacterium]|uniref:Peptidoglycan binding-like domain-containing protein n=1 Tax=Candidatus Kaiserbacteria bacterium CG10_big_fil_rev_8_21_14_0_10_47_16 TaxID=1974608 RepID=A0A2H0UEJ4_9BACT|nr:hypothetical protein [Candidatus Parcubacteria bacterium]PIR84829.1 MAG: hypothetical protein COU16_00370 [Candidatus Kaiserbacteria bacterium CG10_big_fil_rev_8_21_14_0_10_47_16]
MSITNTLVAKLAVAFVAVSMLATLAMPAKAATVDELQALIAQLQAQISALTGSGGASAAECTFTGSLTVGSQGAQVTCLQQYLVAANHLTMPTGVSYGYFGPLTQAAVAAWQAANGVAPAVGYFGPISQAKYAMVAGTTGGTGTGSTGSVTLNGKFGTIASVTNLSQYNNEEVGEDESDVKVLGMDVEAADDGDIQLTAMSISFNTNSNSGSTRLNRYVDSVSVWQGSTEVATIDVDDFTKGNNNVYTKTAALKSAVVRAGDTEKFYVTVTAKSNLDSTDIAGDAITVDVDSIRVLDGSGVTINDTTSNGADVAMNFVSFSTSADTELKISTASDTPNAGVVVIDDSSNTDDVVLLKGKIKLDGSSDVTIDEFPVTLTTVGGANVTAVTGSLKLVLDGEEYTESVSITGSTLVGTVTFDNLDFDMSAGDTIEFEVLADINDIDAGNLDEGDTLTASVTSTNRDYIDAENEEGDQLSDSTEKSGTATGEAQEFRTSGIQLKLISATTSSTAGNSASDDLGTFTIKYSVTAIGDTAYVSSLADAQLTGVTTGYTTAHADRAGTATVGGVSTVLVNVTDATLTSVGLYQIEEGSTETFELTTTVQLPTAGQAGSFRVALGGVSWDTDSTDPTPDNAYTSDLDTFKTSYLGLN